MRKSYSAIVEYPPFSINKAWQGRRFKTPAYGKWRLGLASALKNKISFSKVEGWVKLDLHFYIKYFATTDVDNLVKGFVDGLVDAEIIEDDRKITHYTIRKHKVDKMEDEKIKFRIKKDGY